jgi:SAM-dependent methyltransferase
MPLRKISMSSAPWNHNIHYYDWVLSCVPTDCKRALDLGCGTGLLVERLAGRCDETIGIEFDHATCLQARSKALDKSHIHFIEGDVMTYPFQENSFDLITAVAVLHHLPLVPALARVRRLLAPGGVLALIGLYRPRSIADFMWEMVAIPVDWSLRMRLPGSEIKRRMLYRYSLYWRKP